MADCVDDIALIRSMYTSHSNHYNATLGMHTGSFAFARPSIGAWVSYGLGTVNRNLPSFVVIAPQMPYAGTQVWASDFLPGAHQGTRVVPGPEPMPNLARRVATGHRQELELAALDAFNESHLATRGDDPRLAARIKSFETAFGMQSEMPAALDLSAETDATLALYGLPRGGSEGFGWQCLVARRLVERGVRFVELIDTGSSGNWDSHGDMADHGRLAKNVDQPIAGLLKDLKQRGLLDDVLVVWTTEFGRTPFNNTAENKGREHHSWAFSSWLAGAGVRAGYVHGATDEHGIRAGREAGPCPRLPRHDPASDGPRPHPPDLSPRRPRLSPDRRAWQRRRRHPGLIGSDPCVHDRQMIWRASLPAMSTTARCLTRPFSSGSPPGAGSSRRRPFRGSP